LFERPEKLVKRPVKRGVSGERLQFFLRHEKTRTRRVSLIAESTDQACRVSAAKRVLFSAGMLTSREALSA
jgi:hypothetical protein